MSSALCVCLLLLCGLMAAGTGEAAAEDHNYIVNGEFGSHLTSWKVQGTVTALPGDKAVRLGPGSASLSQRYSIGGLRIVYFGALLHADSAEAKGMVRVRCYDEHNRLVMEESAPLDPAKEIGKEVSKGMYFKAQAHTHSIEVSIETAGPGTLLARTPVLNDYDHDRKPHHPEISLDDYMRPFWQSPTVTDETVLMLGSDSQPACGSLMFTPIRILSVRSYTAGETYEEGRDYTLEGRTLTLTPQSRIHAMTSHDFPTTDLGWYTVTGKQILVSYTHADTWNGPLPASQAELLPHTRDLLRARRPVTIVADGDSITLGLNTSGYSDMPPFMPTWADLFAYRLKKEFGDGGVHLYNVGLGGMTSDWGRDTADAAVGSLEPDLVLIAFGMNDFWWVPADQFEQNVRKMMETIRKRKPMAEFILIAPMQFDPEYAHDLQYHERLMSYLPAINALKGPGVAVLDMTSITGELFKRKKPKDIVTDPLHPTDFLARWYAQGLAVTIGP